jgi:MoaA/NifB/PqqE/SkfB family radical SAM enzyme
MAARLEGVRRSGVPFAFIFTLTQHNLDELDWVAGFALDQGARLLQIHPLNPVGRARERLPAGRPDATAAAFAYLEAQRIQALAGDRLRVQLDLVHAGAIRRRPGRVFAGHCPEGETPCRLAEIVSPLVVEADGTVVPVQYGFARRYALGNLQEASLAELAMRWRRERYSSFQRLCRRIFDDLAAPPTLPFFNWYDTIQRQAEDERAL